MDRQGHFHHDARFGLAIDIGGLEAHQVQFNAVFVRQASARAHHGPHRRRDSSFDCGCGTPVTIESLTIGPELGGPEPGMEIEILA